MRYKKKYCENPFLETIQMGVKELKVICSLTKGGQSIFKLIMIDMKDMIVDDSIYLKFDDLNLDITKKSYYNGLNDLRAKEIIVQDCEDNFKFYINQNYYPNA